MVTREEIQTTCGDILQEFAPLQVILFGSYATEIRTSDRFITVPTGQTTNSIRHSDFLTLSPSNPPALACGM